MIELFEIRFDLDCKCIKRNPSIHLKFIKEKNSSSIE